MDSKEWLWLQKFKRREVLKLKFGRYRSAYVLYSAWPQDSKAQYTIYNTPRQNKFKSLKNRKNKKDQTKYIPFLYIIFNLFLKIRSENSNVVP